LIEKKLPEGWEWQKLKNISEINPKFDKSTVNGDIDVSFIPMSNVEEMTGKIDLSQNRPLKEVIKGYTPLRNGDLLFAKITPCMENGKIAVADGLKNRLGFASTEFHVIRFGRNVIPDFYRYYLLWEKIRKQAEKNMTGSAGQKRVPTSFIQNLVVPVPPPETQRKIVAILEKAEATQRLRAEADALMQQQSISLFNNMFGDPVSNRMKWEVRKLGELATIKDVDHKMPIGVEEGIYYISTKDFHSLDSIDFSGAKKISEHDFQQLSKKIEPKYGDIIYSRYGTIGEVRLVPKDVKFQISYSLCIIRLEKDVIKLKFLYYLLKNPNFLRYALSKKRSSAIPDLGLNEIKQFNIIVPPLPLQQEFLNSIKKYEILLQSQKLSASQIELMNASLFNRAFNGKLVV